MHKLTVENYDKIARYLELERQELERLKREAARRR